MGARCGADGIAKGTGASARAGVSRGDAGVHRERTGAAWAWIVFRSRRVRQLRPEGTNAKHAGDSTLLCGGCAASEHCCRNNACTMGASSRDGAPHVLLGERIAEPTRTCVRRACDGAPAFPDSHEHHAAGVVALIESVEGRGPAWLHD